MFSAKLYRMVSHLIARSQGGISKTPTPQSHWNLWLKKQIQSIWNRSISKMSKIKNQISHNKYITVKQFIRNSQMNVTNHMIHVGKKHILHPSFTAGFHESCFPRDVSFTCVSWSFRRIIFFDGDFRPKDSINLWASLPDIFKWSHL